jgi:hypothetical protein
MRGPTWQMRRPVALALVVGCAVLALAAGGCKGGGADDDAAMVKPSTPAAKANRSGEATGAGRAPGEATPGAGMKGEPSTGPEPDVAGPGAPAEPLGSPPPSSPGASDSSRPGPEAPAAPAEGRAGASDAAGDTAGDAKAPMVKRLQAGASGKARMMERAMGGDAGGPANAGKAMMTKHALEVGTPPGSPAGDGARRTLQNAVDLYHNDVGAWPPNLDALTAGKGPTGYHGPYLRTIPEPPDGGKWTLARTDGVVGLAP